MIYLDGCYIAKFYLAEPDSQVVIARVMSEDACGSSLHGQIEVNAVFHRKMREGIMTSADLQLLTAQFDSDCQAGLWSWFPLESAIVDTAITVIRGLSPTTYLRTGDAMHLACAAHHGFTNIFSNDKHLINAAPQFGLTGIKL